MTINFDEVSPGTGLDPLDVLCTAVPTRELCSVVVVALCDGIADDELLLGNPPAADDSPLAGVVIVLPLDVETAVGMLVVSALVTDADDIPPLIMVKLPGCNPVKVFTVCVFADGSVMV